MNIKDNHDDFLYHNRFKNMWILTNNLTIDDKFKLEKLSKNDSVKCCYFEPGPDTNFLDDYITSNKYVAFRELDHCTDPGNNSGII